jgi:CRP/FNR family cyclic AMP-dependent transcriptional regulator
LCIDAERNTDAHPRPWPPPLFSSLPTSVWTDLVERSSTRKLGRSEVVYIEGDRGTSLHVIKRGWFAPTVLTHRGESITLSVLTPGEVFGELALIRGDPTRGSSIVAMTEGETLAIEREVLQDLRREYPRLNEELLSIVGDKATRSIGHLMDALHVSAETRVLRRLLELADSFPPGKIRITQQQLAAIAGASRGTANKVLRHEEKQGNVAISRGSILILDRKALERSAR